jgi:hypothetical protein
MAQAFVHLDGWAGRSKHAVEVLGECQRRGQPHYKVRLLERAYRHAAGAIHYPPVWAVTFASEEKR